MNKNAKAWVKALRSGKYKQGYGRLSTKHPDTNEITYCCLGVACEVYNEANKNNPKALLKKKHFSADVFQFDEQVWHLPAKVISWLGFHQGKQHNLIKLNDSREYSFKKIADYIVKSQSRLFRK